MRVHQTTRLRSWEEKYPTPMTLVLELPDAWKCLLGLDTADAPERAREMLITESYREKAGFPVVRRRRCSRTGLYEAEAFFKRHGAEQQPSWEELEARGDKLRAALQS